MSHRINWRKNWDYEKHGGYRNPNSNVFFGPITVRELKKSIEMADALIKTKKNVKKEQTTEPIPESLDNKLNRTFDMIENNENVDICSGNSKLDTTFEINTEKEDSENASYLPMIASEPLKDISNMNGILATTFEDLKINESADNLSNISVNSIKNLSTSKKGSLLDATFPSLVRAYLQTPLIDKMTKYSQPNNVDNVLCDSISDKTLTNENSIHTRTPHFVKLSDTFITELLPERCLIDNSISNDTMHSEAMKSPSTPDIFQQKCNEMWKMNPSSQKVITSCQSFRSKIPMKKTPIPNRYFYAKSPVADYIHKGLKVQSMSKIRHSNCVKEDNVPKSKSDNKSNKPSKLPVVKTSVAKRKLVLETKNLKELKREKTLVKM